MAAALSAAHAVAVIHRDLKANNVMLLDTGPSRPPRVVITDFGLAHMLGDTRSDGDGAITLSGDVVGTPEYMSPEQIEGGVLTPASDIYALGILICASSVIAFSLSRITNRQFEPRSGCGREPATRRAGRVRARAETISRLASRGRDAVCARCLPVRSK
jgi:serine/threonine protein kinase